MVEGEPSEVPSRHTVAVAAFQFAVVAAVAEISPSRHSKVAHVFIPSSILKSIDRCSRIGCALFTASLFFFTL